MKAKPLCGHLRIMLSMAENDCYWSNIRQEKTKEMLKPNPEYENAPYELSVIPPGDGLIFHRFNESPPANLSVDEFDKWVLEHSIPPFVELKEYEDRQS